MLQSADAVELALKLDGEELKKRKLRVQRCVKKPTRKSYNRMENNFGKNRNQELKKSFSKTKSNEQTNVVEEHEEKEDVFNISDSDKKPVRKHRESSKEFSQFQGQKISEDKKLKKVMSQNILAVCTFVRSLNTMTCRYSNLRQI
jgi:hypothetical protein